MTENKNLDIRIYKKALINYKHQIWKIIPLHEAGNEHIDSYIETISGEIFGMESYIIELPHGYWYVRVLNTLERLEKKPYEKEDFKKVRKEVLKMVNLIDKELEHLRGVWAWVNINII